METTCTSTLCYYEPPKFQPLSKLSYFVGLFVIITAVLSQYLVSVGGIFNRLFVIYGIPIIVASALFGKTILRRAFRNTGKAFDYGLAFWGVLSIAAFFLEIIIINWIFNNSPDSINALDQPNPVVPSSARSVWLMVFASIFIIGPAEEYIFRGFIFGGLLKIFKNRHWISLALLSSLLFAFVHFYYFLTYGLFSSIFFIEIITVSMALSISYYVSGGNLLVPTILHGLFDASGFLGVATGSELGFIFRILIVGVGIIAALILALRYLASKLNLRRVLS